MKIRVQKGNEFQRQVFSLLSADVQYMQRLKMGFRKFYTFESMTVTGETKTPKEL